MMEFRKILALVGSLLTVQLVMASGGEASKPEAIVHGYVLDAATRKPVAGVVVLASSGKTGVSKEVATDASGYFKIRQLPEGKISVQFDKKGYRNVRKESIVIKDGDVLKMSIDFYAEKSFTESFPDGDHPVLRLVDGVM